MSQLADALVAAGLVSKDHARYVRRGTDKRNAAHQTRKHRDLASRAQDSQMSDDDIARELLAACRKA